MTNYQIINEVSLILDKGNINIEEVLKKTDLLLCSSLTLDFFDLTYLTTIPDYAFNIYKEDEISTDSYSFYLRENLNYRGFNPIPLINLLLYKIEPNLFILELFSKNPLLFDFKDSIKLNLELLESIMDSIIFIYVFGNNSTIDYNNILMEECRGVFPIEVFEYWGDTTSPRPLKDKDNITLSWLPCKEITEGGVKFSVPDLTLWQWLRWDISMYYLKNLTYWWVYFIDYKQTFSFIDFWLPIFIFLIIDCYFVIIVFFLYFINIVEFLDKKIIFYNISNRMFRYILVIILLFVGGYYLEGYQIFWSLIQKYFMYFFKHITRLHSTNLNFESFFVKNINNKGIFFLLENTEDSKFLDKLNSLIHFT